MTARPSSGYQTGAPALLRAAQDVVKEGKGRDPVGPRPASSPYRASPVPRVRFLFGEGEAGYNRYWGRGRISALMTGTLRDASALEFFESRPTRRKTQSRHSDGEGAVNLST
jgi:hypothetical protein